MRSRRIKLLAPAAQFAERLGLELALEVGSLDWIHFRRREKWVDEGFDIESRSSNDYCVFHGFVSALNPVVRFVRPSGGGVAVLRVGDIDAVVGDMRALLTLRFGGSDVEAPIDLSRIRAHNRGVVDLAKLQSNRGFACGGRTTDHSQSIACQSAALPRPR